MKMNARSTLDVKNDVDDDDDDENGSSAHCHVNTVTTILGESSTILMALRNWREAIEMAPSGDKARERLLMCCEESWKRVDREACTLAATVGKWMMSDLGVLSWVDVVRCAQLGRKMTVVSDFSSSLLYHYYITIITTVVAASANAPLSSFSRTRQARNYENRRQENIKLGCLDVLLDEVAFLCEVTCRYHTFVDTDAATSESSPFKAFKNDICGAYSTLECFHVKRSVDVSFSIAAPLSIIENAYSPSYMEDVFYVCRKALERCLSVRCETVAITVVDFCLKLYGVDGEIMSGLKEEVGCRKKDGKDEGNRGEGGGHRAQQSEREDEVVSQKPVGMMGMFAAALLDAVDATDEDARGASGRSFGRLGADVVDSYFQTDAERVFSKMTKVMGISAGSRACHSLAQTMEEHGMDGTPHMDALKEIQTSYDDWMKVECKAVVDEWLGSVDDAGIGEFEIRENDRLVFLRIRKYVGGIDYDMEEKDFDILESDRRIEKVSRELPCCL